MGNPYTLLGLKASDRPSKDDIRQAYLSKCKELHPDRNKSSVAVQEFQAVQKAFDYLTKADPNDIPPTDNFPHPYYREQAEKARRRAQQYSQNPYFFRSLLYQQYNNPLHTNTNSVRHQLVTFMYAMGVLAIGCAFSVGMSQRGNHRTNMTQTQLTQLHGSQGYRPEKAEDEELAKFVQNQPKRLLNTRLEVESSADGSQDKGSSSSGAAYGSGSGSSMNNSGNSSGVNSSSSGRSEEVVSQGTNIEDVQRQQLHNTNEKVDKFWNKTYVRWHRLKSLHFRPQVDEG